MKKWMVFLAMLMLLVAVAIPAFAANTEVAVAVSGDVAYAGDEITVTVSVSGDVLYTSIGYVPSYDKDVFEFVSFTAADNTGASINKYDETTGACMVMFESAKAYAGELFTLKLKVKADAPLKTVTIGGEVKANNQSDAVAVTIKSAQVVIECHHSYEWTKVDDNTHKGVCACGDVKTENHDWSGEVTDVEPATCIKPGSEIQHCSGCGATNKVTVKAKGHAWDNDCDTDCNNGCGETRDVSHSYSDKWSTDQENHWRVCTICGKKKDEAAHKPGAAATDKNPQVCTECGYVIQQALEHVHDFGEEWQQGAESHWHACAGCDEKKDEATHIPGPAATERDPQTCTECGYVLQAALKHVHDFDTSIWQKDSQNHWHVCKKAGCYTWGSSAPHDYDDECDVTCNTCGYVRIAPHHYGTEWQGNAYGHWVVCLLCGEQSSIMPHIPGDPATQDTPQTCTECQYWLMYPLSHEHSYELTWETDDYSHWKCCRECGASTEQEQHNWNEGTVIAEATETQDGMILFSCLNCGYERRMIVAATGTQTTPTQPSDATDPTEQTGPVETRPIITPLEEQEEFPWWILVVVAGTLLVTGIALFVIEFIRGKKHNTHGKFSK